MQRAHFTGLKIFSVGDRVDYKEMKKRALGRGEGPLKHLRQWGGENQA